MRHDSPLPSKPEDYVISVQAFQELLEVQLQVDALRRFFSNPNHKNFVDKIHAAIDQVLRQAHRRQS